MLDIGKVIKNSKNKTLNIIFMSIMLVVLCMVNFFAKNRQGGKGETIICFVVICTMLFLLCIYIWTEIAIDKFTFLFVLLVGGMSLLMQPIFNIPDEATHFARAEMISRGIISLDHDAKEYETIKAFEDLHKNSKEVYTRSDLNSKEISYEVSRTDNVAAANLFIFYLPQTVGILIAKVFHFKVIWLLWLARFVNLFSYALLIALAVKFASRFWLPLFFVAVLPISIQQAASVSPDAMINGLALLLIGYFLHLYCNSEEKITEKELITFALLGNLVTLAKVTNIFLAGLILLIPKERFSNTKNCILKKSLIITESILVGGIYYYYTTTFAINLQQAAYLVEMNVNSKFQLQYILSNTKEWFRGFGANLIDQVSVYINMLNTFGWFEYGYPALTPITIFMFAKICFQEQKLYICKKNKGLVFLMIMGIYVFSCLAMYISWTSVGANEIMGVQGRYFIPMLALSTLMFFSSSEKIKSTSITYIDERKHGGDITMISIMIGIMLITTAVWYY